MTGKDGKRANEENKLTRVKKRWATEGRFLTGAPARPGARLPPGQHLVRDWPVLDLGEQPAITRDEWRMTIDGLVDHPACWDWAALMRLPQTLIRSDIHCVTSWSRFDNHWQGVSSRDLMAAVRPMARARFVMIHGHDEYSANLSLQDFAAEGVLLAHSWEGAPLSRQHGGPVRLVVPQLYFWKSAKWISRITFLKRDEPGLWEANGYHNRGDPWREQRYSATGGR